MTLNGLITTAEAAERCGLSQVTIQRLARAGLLHSIRISRLVLIESVGLQAAVKSRPRRGRPIKIDVNSTK